MLRRMNLLAIAALCLLVAGAWGTVRAATYTVSTLDDFGAGSLREAIGLANGTPDNDVINFSVNGTITLANGELLIANAGALSIINGPGANLLTVSGGGVTRVFRIGSGANATFYGLTIANGQATPASSFNVGAGGGIFNYGGILSVVNCTFYGNHANGSSGNSRGGGIYNSTVANIKNTIIAGNSVTGAVPAGPDGAGNFVSQGYNLIGKTDGSTGFTATGDQTGTIAAPLDAQFLPLSNYGGTTRTHALLPNSPAINAGNTATSPTLDQRGAGRIGTADIGAFELNNTANGGAFVALLPRSAQGQSYNFALIPNNGAFIYTRTAGALPNGLSLGSSFAQPDTDSPLLRSAKDGGSLLAPAAAVTISGTPSMPGANSFALTASDGANSNITNYQLDILGPTASGVAVSGYILTQLGRAPRNATVTLTDLYGQAQTTTVNRFGYYQFTEVAAGQTYFVTVEAKGYNFMPPTAVVTPNFEVQDLNFTAFNTQ